MTNRAIESLTDKALDAFWKAVAEHYPQAKTGDLSPLQTIKLQRAAESAIEEWIDNNVTIANRCIRAGQALAAYSDDDAATNLVDFLADAMHWCQAKGHDFSALFGTAEMHFKAEITKEEGASS